MYSDLVVFDGEKFDLGYDNVYKVAYSKDLKRVKDEKLKIVECDEFNLHEVLKKKVADVVLLNEKSHKDHLHFRKTALNQVTAKLAKKNGIIIAFSLAKLFNATNKSQVMGRWMQSFRLCRKYGLKVIVASFALNKHGMRSPHDIIALLKVLGMTGKEAKQALNTAQDKVEEVPEISKGVKIVKDED